MSPRAVPLARPVPLDRIAAEGGIAAHIVLRGIRLTDLPDAHDVTIRDGRFTRIAPTGTPADHGLVEIDASGWLALPPFAEPHIHLDKALTVDRAPNRSGDLAGAIDAWLAHRPLVDYDDVYERARRMLQTTSLNGVAVLRTHVDTGIGASLGAVEALVDLRRELRGTIDVQIVAGHGLPVTGPQGEEGTALLRQALELGADAVGGAPSLDADPVGAYRILSAVAHEHGVPLDLHVDETLDPRSFLLGAIAADAARARVPITVGHIVSLAVQDAGTRRETSARLADAGVGVVTLPQTNLFLQGRGEGPVRPRGLTALGDLYEAGVNVAAGSDNIADPFNPLGRADPLETASLLIASAHLDLATALTAIGDGARTLLGVPPSGISVGAPADLLAVRADSLAFAVAQAPPDRVLWRSGAIVAATATARTWSPVP